MVTRDYANASQSERVFLFHTWEGSTKDGNKLGQICWNMEPNDFTIHAHRRLLLRKVTDVHAQNLCNRKVLLILRTKYEGLRFQFDTQYELDAIVAIFKEIFSGVHSPY